MREGQLEFILSVLHAARRGGITVIEAPSGLGKTAGILAAMSCLAESEGAKFVYAVRTHSQISRVMEECSRFSRLRIAAFRGKGELCINPKVRRMRGSKFMNYACRYLREREECPYYRVEELEAPRCFDPVSLKLSNSCPYYSSINIVRSGDYDALVLCYPYLFDPELELPLEMPDGTYLIVDEAHNLRKYWISSRISSMELWKIEEQLIASCPRWIELRRSLAEARVPYLEIPRSYLLFLLREAESKENAESLRRFLERFIIDIENSRRLILEPPNLILLRDQGKRLEDSLNSFRASILISGSWSEEVARSEILEDLDYVGVSLEEWGDVAAFITRDFTTRFEERCRLEYYRIASALADLSEVVRGNMGVFASSYDVLEGIIEAGFENMVTKPVFIERRGLSSRDVSEIISEFKRLSNVGAILLGVQGGRSSEGEDYPGLQMTTSIIVGLQLTKPSALGSLHEILWRKHTSLQKPSLTNACRAAAQAAARPVRSRKDIGFIVFADRRFIQCSPMLPKWIRGRLSFARLEQIPSLGEEFFNARSSLLSGV